MIHMMKYTLLSCVAALALLPCEAVQTAENYEAAKGFVQDDGYILFAYAEDWDPSSKRVCDRLMAAEAVQQAAGQAVFMRVPIPNVMTDERKAADKERFGPLQVADAPDYPAILMLDRNGRHYATITGPFMHKAAGKKLIDKVAELIVARRHGQRQQADLLARAEKAKGAEKAQLLGAAATVPDINPVDKIGKIINQIKQLDPKDESGYARKLRAPMDFVGEIVGIERSKDPGKGWEAALAKVQEYLKDPVYTKPQQQALHALAVGLLHRHGGPRRVDEMLSHTRAIATLVPDNYLGKSAALAEREWAVGFNLADGWTPAVVAENTPIELSGPLPIAGPGAYSVTFTYERGRHGCNIAAVSLYDGKTLVAEDRHPGSAGRASKNNVYKLQLNTLPKEPHLFIEFDQKGNNDSFGHIIITRG